MKIRGPQHRTDNKTFATPRGRHSPVLSCGDTPVQRQESSSDLPLSLQPVWPFKMLISGRCGADTSSPRDSPSSTSISSSPAQVPSPPRFCSFSPSPSSTGHPSIPQALDLGSLTLPTTSIPALAGVFWVMIYFQPLCHPEDVSTIPESWLFEEAGLDSALGISEDGLSASSRACCGGGAHPASQFLSWVEPPASESEKQLLLRAGAAATDSGSALHPPAACFGKGDRAGASGVCD